MRRAARKDANHNAIAVHLKTCGWTVLDLSGVGNGCPDMLVAKPGGMAALVECKDGAKSESRRKLTLDQAEFAKKWPGTLVIAKSPEDAELQLDLAEKYQYLRKGSA